MTSRSSCIALIALAIVVGCSAHPASESTVPTLSAAASHTRAHGDLVDASGAFYDWGDNDAGQLGVGTTGPKFDAKTPEPAFMPNGVVSTGGSAGQSDTVAVTTTGDVYAWGFNAFGELGDGTSTNENVPVQTHLPAGVHAISVAAGYKHMLAVTTGGAVYGWGYNKNGQLGIGTIKNALLPVSVLLPAGAIAVQAAGGKYHSLFVTSDGSVYASGFDSAGQLGNGGTAQVSTPVRAMLPDGVAIAQVSAGDAHSLALTSSGAVYAWGDNTSGQLGNGTFLSSTTPVSVSLPPNTTVTAISAGENYSLALTSTGLLYAWGNNDSGTLGDGNTMSSNVPVLVQIPPGVVPVAIAAGGNRSHLLTSNGMVYNWGTSENGSHQTLLPTPDKMPPNHLPVALFAGPDAEQYIVLMR